MAKAFLVFLAIVLKPMVEAKYSGLHALRHFYASWRCTASAIASAKLWCSYADLMAVYRKVLSEYSQEDQRKVFHDNAARFYRV
jgi:hypothetical protein